MKCFQVAEKEPSLFRTPGRFRIGADAVEDDTDVSCLATGLSGTNVVINACSTGDGSNGQSGSLLVENFARSTKSTVVASNTDLKSGYKFDGSEIPTSDGKPNSFVMSR